MSVVTREDLKCGSTSRHGAATRLATARCSGLSLAREEGRLWKVLCTRAASSYNTSLVPRCLKCLCGLVDCLIKRSFHSSLQLAGKGGGGAKRPWSSLCLHSNTPRWTCHSRWLPSSRWKDTPRHTKVYFPNHVTPPWKYATSHVTPRHTALHYTTSHNASHPVTLLSVTPHHRTHETTSLHCFALRHITSLYTVYNVMRRHTVLYHSILHYVTLYYITQHCFTSYCITSGNTSLRHTIS